MNISAADRQCASAVAIVNGEDRKQLSSAIRSAFPSRSKLRVALKYGADRELNDYVGEKGLEEDVAELIGEAVAGQWISALVRGLYLENPTTELRRLFFKIARPDAAAVLSHDDSDRAEVEALGKGLTEHGVNVLMHSCAVPLDANDTATSHPLRTCSAVLVCLGKHGAQRWHDPVLRQIVEPQMQSTPRLRVTPVLLESAPRDLQMQPMPAANGVVDVSAKTKVVEALYTAITGEILEQRSPPPPSPPAGNDVEEVHKQEEYFAHLVRTLRRKNVVFFLGSGVVTGALHLPTPCELARDLLDALQFIRKPYEHLLPSLDIAGSYYAISKSHGELEDLVLGRIRDGSKSIPNALQELASLIKCLGKRPRRDLYSAKDQLLVTTNLDVLIERALLTSGISFTRIVQNTERPQLVINEYKNVCVQDHEIYTPAGERVPLGGPDSIDEFIATHGRSEVVPSESDTGVQDFSPIRNLDLSRYTKPILYKLRGSNDIDSSCAISAEKVLEFMVKSVRARYIPTQIANIIKESDVVLLGYSLLDPEFRLMFHMLLDQAVGRKFAVQNVPAEVDVDNYQRIEGKLWKRLKRHAAEPPMRINTLELSGETFLRTLRQKSELEIVGHPPAASA